MLNKKIEEVTKAIEGISSEKAVEVEIQERSANEPHNAEGLIVDEITTTITIYDKQELKPNQEFAPKELVYDQEEAARFIHSAITRDPEMDFVSMGDSLKLIKRVLDIDEEYMRSKGIIDD